jgi:hypothetical protein
LLFVLRLTAPEKRRSWNGALQRPTQIFSICLGEPMRPMHDMVNIDTLNACHWSYD